MAIRVEHGPSAALVGRMSYGAGEAMGKEEAQRNLLDKWMQYYGVKKPLEVQERIADKNLAYQREYLGAQKDWFDRNYILDEQRVGFEGQRIGLEGERIGIDRDRLGIDSRRVDIEGQRVSNDFNLGQGQLSNQLYVANQQANLARQQMEAPYLAQREQANRTVMSLGYGQLTSGSLASPVYQQYGGESGYMSPSHLSYR